MPAAPAAEPSTPQRRVLVTGASSGIGAGIAAVFAAQGAQVLATGATAAELQVARERGLPAGVALRLMISSFVSPSRPPHAQDA